MSGNALSYNSSTGVITSAYEESPAFTGNVGIGVTPAAWKTSGAEKVLQIDTASLYNNSDNNVYLNSNWFLNSSGQVVYIESDFATSFAQVAGNHIWYGAASGTAGNTTTLSEHMRIDSSGNLLVGKTAVGVGNAGIELRANNMAAVTRSGDNVLYLNRTTNDGSILEFRKDNSVVGNIGVDGGSLVIGGGDVGIGFYQSADALVPINGGTRAVRDSAIDLGMSSAKYKDLYLSGNAYVGSSGFLSNNSGEFIKLDNVDDTIEFSTTGSERWRFNSSGHFTPAQQHTYDIGGVNAELRNIHAQGLYVGGSAAANKLDDYEEGTWTPALGNITTNSISVYGIYTKIGNLVHIHAKITATVASLPGATWKITGLPFTATNSSDTGQREIIAIGGDCSNLGGYANGRASFRTDGAELQGVYLNSGSSAYWTYNTMDHTTFELHLSGTYRV